MFNNNEYLKNIVTLMSGVFLAQVVLFCGSLIITRIFPPDDFGVIAFYISLVHILVVISTFRYEHSIVLPKKDSDSYDIMRITKKIVIYFAIILLIIIILFSKEILNLISKPKFEYFLFFLPLFIIFNGFFFIYRSWLVRKKNFKRISIATLIKSIVLTLLLITGGIIFDDLLVFLFANIIAQIVETVYLQNAISRQNFDKNNAVNQLKLYSDFPKFSLPADLISTYTSQNPVILFSFFFGDYIVGQFSLTQRVLAIPVKFISGSTLEVYKQKASEAYNKVGNCYDICLSTFKKLFLIGLIPTLFMFFFAPYLFEVLFGIEWKQAGNFAKYMMPMFFLQFSLRPLSYTLYIAGKQNYNLYWQIGLLTLTSLGIYLGIFYESSYLSVVGYSLSYTFMYLIYFFLILNASKGK
tara:strand:- start:18514 stop:19746 length:1233 start_codon:yes stop_codon:yes gene_type:complete